MDEAFNRKNVIGFYEEIAEGLSFDTNGLYEKYKDTFERMASDNFDKRKEGGQPPPIPKMPKKRQGQTQKTPTDKNVEANIQKAKNRIIYTIGNLIDSAWWDSAKVSSYTELTKRFGSHKELKLEFEELVKTEPKVALTLSKEMGMLDFLNDIVKILSEEKNKQ